MCVILDEQSRNVPARYHDDGLRNMSQHVAVCACTQRFRPVVVVERRHRHTAVEL